MNEAVDLKVEGILDFRRKTDAGLLLDTTRNGRPQPSDPFVPKDLIRHFKLKRGSYINGNAQCDGRFPKPKLNLIHTIDGLSIESRKCKLDFTRLTTLSPDQQLYLETADGRMTTRVIDLFCPIGKGQRGLIVAPPRTGKTTLLQDIARGTLENHPECKIIILLVDERPEEVTDFKRCIENAEVYASSNDEPLANHIRVAEIAIERAKRLVEVGADVVFLLDSLTRLARAHNAVRGSGRTMTGGLDIRALEKPRQLFSTARNTEEAGSLTILASTLIETGSKMDELIFQEFKGTGNMEMVLDRKIAELRIWPSVNLAASGTRREELLLTPEALEGAQFLRRALLNQKPIEATETLIQRLEKTKTNAEFLRFINR